VSEYFGLEAIGKRMGVRGHTIRYWIDETGFPAFRRRRPGRIRRARDCQRLYYTNDEMILAWQLGRANQERQERLARREARARARRQTTDLSGSNDGR